MFTEKYAEPDFGNTNNPVNKNNSLLVLVLMGFVDNIKNKNKNIKYYKLYPYGDRGCRRNSSRVDMSMQDVCSFRQSSRVYRGCY